MGLGKFLLTVVAGGFALPGFAGGQARHVVVIVWDGMRPDFVSQQNTPTLFQLSKQGVWFRNHHAAFVSSTEVNAAVLATGGYPGQNTLLGNEEYRPQIDPLRSVNTADWSTVRQGDSLTDGHYLGLPTLAELVQLSGRRAVIAGAKTVGLLALRSPSSFAPQSEVFFSGKTIPSNLLNHLTESLGRFPVSNATNSLRNDWTTQALTNVLWAKEVPVFSLLWLNQPDYSQHETGPGSPQTLASIQSLDHNLARVLDALEARGIRKTTDILVISDHGFSTIWAKVNLAEALQKAGFRATREFQNPPQQGDVMIVSNGGASFIYVIGHDPEIVRRIVRFLQGWEHSGVIFTRNPLPGTFTLKQIRADASDAPDILVSLRWTANNSSNGTPGLVISDSGYGPGQGTHGSLSPFEMRNLMIAIGPDFRTGVVDNLATGNVDVAPTVLWLLGIKTRRPLDGRILTEALKTGHFVSKPSKSYRVEASNEIAGQLWHQYLDLTQAGDSVYPEAGNGRQEALPKDGHH